MSEANIDFPIYDVDNHMYETVGRVHEVPAARVLADHQATSRSRGARRSRSRTSSPTTSRTRRSKSSPGPGAQQDYFKHGNPEGKSRREILGEPMRSIDAYFAPGPRLALMDELGIDRAIMWPTLASLLEERLSDDPRATHAVDPRVQPVDARAVDVQLRGPHLPDAGDHAADRRARRSRSWSGS